MAKVSAMPAVTAGDVVDADEFYILDGGVSKKISAVNLAQISQITSRYVAQSTLTTDGDVLTRASGSPARITRADLAQDTAFSSRYAPLPGTFTSYTPTLTPATGTITTVHAATAVNWLKLGKLMYAHFEIRITTVGTASGVLNVSMPSGETMASIPSGTHLGSWVEANISGVTGSVGAAPASNTFALHTTSNISSNIMTADNVSFRGTVWIPLA